MFKYSALTMQNISCNYSTAQFSGIALHRDRACKCVCVCVNVRERERGRIRLPLTVTVTVTFIAVTLFLRSTSLFCSIQLPFPATLTEHTGHE